MYALFSEMLPLPRLACVRFGATCSLVRSSAIFLAISLGLVACAPPRASTTTVNAAAVPSSEAAEPSAASATAEPAPQAAKEAPPPALDAPPGQLVCKTTRPLEGTTELYLEWSGGEAKGTLRTIAPSGLVHEQKVQAERYQGRIIVDDLGSTDLAVHAAVVKGERILFETATDWAACEK